MTRAYHWTRPHSNKRAGYESTRAIGLKLSGQAPKKVMDSGAALIRREDLDREETRQLLFPDIQKYLKGN